MVVGVSSCGHAPDSTPPGQSGGHYPNSHSFIWRPLILAMRGLCLGYFRHCERRSGENILLVQMALIYTPPLGTSVLGASPRLRHQMAKEMGHEVKEVLALVNALYR